MALTSIILLNSTQQFTFTPFQDAFIAVHANCETSGNSEIHNTVFYSVVIVILDFKHLSNSQSELSKSRRIDTGHYLKKKNNINIMNSDMHHCSFLKQKMGFQKPLSKVQIIPFRFPGF